jgi:LysR family transcriptional regulator, low CO2-responsive transcriptional regulator
MMTAVREGQADFAISFLDPQYDMSGLDVVPVGNDELVLVCAADWPAPDRLLTHKEIGGMPFVTAQRQSARRMIEDSALLELGVVRKNIVLEFGHAEAMKRAVRGGIGAAFLFRSSIGDEIASGTLRVLKVKDLQIEVPICLTRRRDKYFSPFQKALYDYISGVTEVVPVRGLISATKISRGSTVEA